MTRNKSKKPVNTVNEVNAKVKENLQLKVVGSEANHHNFVMVLKDSYSEEIEDVDTKSLGNIVAGVSAELTSRTRIPVGVLIHLIANIGDIVDGAHGLFLKPTLIFDSNSVSPGAVVISETQLSEKIKTDVCIVTSDFLGKLIRKPQEGHSIFYKNAVQEEKVEPIFVAALEKTLEEVGGKSLSHKVALLDAEGDTIHTLEGIMRRPGSSKAPEPGEPTKYNGILMGHDIGKRKIVLEVEKRRIEVDVDFDELFDKITKVLHVLRANVVAEVIESKLDNQIVSIDLKSIDFNKSSTETKENTVQVESGADHDKQRPLGF